MGVKISDFTNVGAPGPGDIFTGLRSAANVNFTIPAATVVTISPVTMSPRVDYIANNAIVFIFNLPATASVGDIFSITGLGSGGWKVQAGTGQIINASGSATSSAGSLASTSQYDSIQLKCIAANTTFSVTGGTGVYTLL